MRSLIFWLRKKFNKFVPERFVVLQPHFLFFFFSFRSASRMVCLLGTSSVSRCCWVMSLLDEQ